MSDPNPSNVYPFPAEIGTTAARRRQHPGQPPSLRTTSLGYARNAGVAAPPATPLSTTSLSSPFSANPQSAYPASPGGAMRGVSPMNFRTLNAAYNPQQWGPVNNASHSSLAAEHRQNTHSTRAPLLAPRLVGPDGKTCHIV